MRREAALSKFDRCRGADGAGVTARERGRVADEPTSGTERSDPVRGADRRSTSRGSGGVVKTKRAIE